MSPLDLFVLVVILLAAVTLGFLWWIWRPVVEAKLHPSDEGREFGNWIHIPVAYVPIEDRVSELFRFRVKPALPYDWQADRAFSPRTPTP